MFKKYQKDLLLFRRLLGYIKPYWLIFSIGFGLTVFLAITESTRPLLIAEMINTFLADTSGSTGEIGKAIHNKIASYSASVDTQMFIWISIIFGILFVEGHFSVCSGLSWRRFGAVYRIGCPGKIIQTYTILSFEIF